MGKIKITGNRDGKNGRNETYTIGSRENVGRQTAVNEVENGKHKGYHIYHINQQKFIRDNPDHSKKDNVNKS